MDLMQVLQQHLNSPTATDSKTAYEHFDELSSTAPPDLVGQCIADAFRAESTRSFGERVAQVFEKSDPQQQAGVLNELLRSIDPGMLPVVAGGILGRMPAPPNGAIPQLTHRQATLMTPEQVQEIATRAQQHDPGVLDNIGAFYALHPQLVKTLESAVLAIVVAGIARRMYR